MNEILINKKIIKLKCKNCSYEWDYKGKNPYYATCPYCYNKVKIEEEK